MFYSGSYRRGKPASGDVDILVTHKNGDKVRGLLNNIIKELTNIGFLKDNLSMPSQKHKHFDESDSYMGICKLKNKKYHRHIDIKVYRPEYFAFAVLYFTGSDHFNRSMRFFAKKKGYTLSDTLIAPAIRVNNDKVFTGKAIPCTTEKEIFDVLGLTYIPPTQRNTYENFGNTIENKINNQYNNNNNNNYDIQLPPSNTP